MTVEKLVQYQSVRTVLGPSGSVIISDALAGRLPHRAAPGGMTALRDRPQTNHEIGVPISQKANDLGRVGGLGDAAQRRARDLRGLF